MYINHPDSDKGNLIIAYVTLDGKFSVTLHPITLHSLTSYSQKYPNPHLQFTNILFNV